MISIYETISKPIINPVTNEKAGNILNADFKGNKLIGFSFFNSEEDEFYLPAANILNFGENIILKTDKYTTTPSGDTTNYLGHELYSKKGDYITTVSDIIINKKTFNIEKIISDKNEQLNASILPKVKCASAVKKKVLKPEQIQEKPVFAISHKNTQSEESIPNKILSNYRFLVGRKTTQPIYDKRGSLLVSAFETLNEEAIIRVWQHDRIWDIINIK